MNHDITVIIPARYGSSRLPGKPLILLAGKPMIQHVYERASQANVTRVIVATDDRRIVQAVEQFGGEAMLTSPDHPSGTDRVAEAARGFKTELVVNVQGDEPLLDPAFIDQAVAPLLKEKTIPMGTLAHPLTDMDERENPNVVKVVCDRRGFALYFSRAPIPFDRDRFADPSVDPSGPMSGRAEGPQGMLRHIGLYVYQADFLQHYARFPPSPLEQLEKLEQLRALELGYSIRVVRVERPVTGVDTPADVEKVRALLEKEEK